MENIITKAEIEKYFGSVADYVSYLNQKIDQCKRNIWDLERSEHNLIFNEDVLELSINNTGFYECLNDCKKAMVKVFKTQLENHELNKINALTYETKN